MEIDGAKLLRRHPISHAGATAVIYSLEATYLIWVYRPCNRCTARDMIVFGDAFSFFLGPTPFMYLISILAV